MGSSYFHDAVKIGQKYSNTKLLTYKLQQQVLDVPNDIKITGHRCFWIQADELTRKIH